MHAHHLLVILCHHRPRVLTHNLLLHFVTYAISHIHSIKDTELSYTAQPSATGLTTIMFARVAACRCAPDEKMLQRSGVHLCERHQSLGQLYAPT